MTYRINRSCWTAAALALAAWTPLLAQEGLQAHADVLDRMRAVARQIEDARQGSASAWVIDELVREYAQLSAQLGGDDPANAALDAGSSSTAASAQGPLAIIAPACGISTSSASFAGTTGPIAGSSFATFTVNVSGVGNFLWDVNLRTTITHTANFDLDIKLISPAGTVVTISTDNGALNDNVFNGTTWDDNVNDPVTDHAFMNLMTATPLSPEGRLQAFRGENPNGVWTLRIEDDALNNTGTLSAWSLDVQALGSTPSQTTTTVMRNPNLALTDNGTVSDSMPVSGLGTFVSKVVLYVEIPHSFPDDLDVRLISPAGTSVVVTTDNGGAFADVFNGTTFDPDAPVPLTDQTFASMVVLASASPEGSFDNFRGQNPNGTWMLQIADDTATHTGTLVRWNLSITTTTNPNPPAPTNFAGPTGAIPDFGAAPATGFTANVSGMGSMLWDVDLNTTIAHGACADLDVTLTSPAGTTVVITTDNGFAAGVFNGTKFDDNANDPVTDHLYTSSVVATPLSPEGRLTAFRGQNPNGVWTLSITDDTPSVNGSLNAWSLDLATIGFAPQIATTMYSRTPNLTVNDNTTVTDTITASGLGTSIEKVVLYTEIQHTWSNDLDVTLQSPAGTIVVVTTDNGNDLDDIFDGTLWDPSVADASPDHAYMDAVAATPLSPEGSFDNFLGQDPNGLWTLSVTDDFSPDTGTFVRWDLKLTTCTVLGPISYCTPTTPGTSNGCMPTISATANPNVAHSNSCVVTVANVEGMKTGIIFYGISGPLNLPWCMAGGNSFLCVKPPTLRTGVQSSGGALGLCNGSLVLNWNAFQLANPSALGHPWMIGNTANVQGWFRDPPACKTTFLSQALELTYQP